MHLVTTFLQETWGGNLPILFLGEKCKPECKKDEWNNLKYLVVEGFCKNPDEKEGILKLARKLEEELLPYFCEQLNTYHGTNHDSRFWRILIGHWYRRYINVVVYRYFQINHCFNSFKPKSTTLIQYNFGDLIPENSNDSIWKFSNPYFSNIMYGKIIQHLKKDIEFDYINFEEISNKSSFNKKKNFIKKIIKNLNKLIPNSSHYIINSYLPKYYDFILKLSFFSIPKYQNLPALNLKPSAIDEKYRFRIQHYGHDFANSSLEALLVKLFFEFIPKVYLEDYSALLEASDKLGYPKHAKFIFTSNNFDTDDAFKLWAAQQVELGGKYIIGQHGNHYGTNKYVLPSVEELVADKFLTWGWSNGLQSHVKAFNLKNPRGALGKFRRDGDILLVQVCERQQTDLYSNFNDHRFYLADQKKFLNLLAKEAKKKLLIRLHPDYVKTYNDDLLFWNSLDPAIRIDSGDRPISKLIAESKLVVFAYDSTGLLECLSANIPTMAFWQNGLDHVSDNAVPFYSLLIDVGIIHLSPKSIANKINDLGNTLDVWWYSANVQDAREKFCQQFCASSNHPIRDLRELLLR